MADEIKIKGLGRIRNKDLVPFTRQLASMTHAGISVLDSIMALEEQAGNPEFKKVIAHVRETIESGSPMSAGLRAFPRIFDDTYVNMIMAGEESGAFDVILRRLSVLLQASARVRRKVKSALTYPIVILSIAMLLSWGLIQFVVPVFAEMFSSFGKELPALTQLMVDISDFGNNWWYVIIPSLVIIFVGFGKWRRTEYGRYRFDRLLLNLPIFGGLIHKAAIARFARVFSQMIIAGVPILKAMEVVSGALNNYVLRDSVMAARDEVEQGRPLAIALEGKPYMPVLMVRMISAGERAGSVEEMLESVADAYDDEVETQLSTLTALMEPLLMVVLGVIVGTIVMAMFMPIFQLGSLAE